MNDKLKSIVRHAYTTTSLYSDMLEKENDNDWENLSIEDFKRLPVIEKNHMIHREGSSLSSEYIVKAYREELINLRTSGSTGKYLNIYWDKADFNRSLLPLWIYRKKYYGIDAYDRMCYFYTARNIGNEEETSYKYRQQLGFSKTNLNMERMVEIYEEMKEFKPKWLNIQPSMAVLLCQCIERYRLTGLDSVEYVEFTGEMLSDSVRDIVEQTFKCKTANQYGANETNSIAYECPYGNMHILSHNAYVEIVDEENKPVDDGKEGAICISSITNRAMPFIRYKIGDRGTKKRVQCLCGNCNEVIDITAGRSNDWIIDENGEKVNTYVFVRAIDNINILCEGAIKQFQIVQCDSSRFVIKLVIDEDISGEQIEELFYENFLQSSLNSAKFEFEYYDQLFADDETGKLRYFVREYE